MEFLAFNEELNKVAQSCSWLVFFGTEHQLKFLTSFHESLDESLSKTSTDVLFPGIPNNYKIESTE